MIPFLISSEILSASMDVILQYPSPTPQYLFPICAKCLREITYKEERLVLAQFFNLLLAPLGGGACVEAEHHKVKAESCGQDRAT